MLDPSWKTDDTPEVLWFERSLNAGGYLEAIAFGFHLGVFFLTLSSLIPNRRNSSAHEPRRGWKLWLQAVLISLLFVNAGLNFVGNAISNQWAWIDYRNFPGGPPAFQMQEENVWPADLANISGVFVSFIADAILIYRCYVIWGNRLVVIALPILHWIALVVLGCLVVDETVRPNGSLWASGTVDVGLAYWSTALALNTVLTLLILSRLWLARRNVRSTMGGGYGHMYTGIAAMIVESALPYTIIAIIFIVLYALQNTSWTLFLGVLVQMEAISPELIILRVARGRAWSSGTNAMLTRGPSAAPLNKYISTDKRSANTSITAGTSTNDIGMVPYKRTMEVFVDDDAGVMSSIVSAV